MNRSAQNIYFTADAHLGNRYLEHPAAAEKKLVRWLDSIRDDAKAIYFLGDMFDYWYEYKYVVPRGYIRFLGKLAELSDHGVEIHLFIGNHDIWMFDYLRDEVGARIHQGPQVVDLLGKRFYLAHGDEIGWRPWMFRFIQAMFRNKICQFFYAGIHPRWTFGFARRWSLASRKTGAEKTMQTGTNRRADALIAFAEEYVHTHPDTHFFIFGHLHLLLDRSIGAARILFAGDWMQHFSYICWNGDQLTLNRFED